ncbi:MAG TPA: GNAT family N-acetyltransferase, partial [Mobilitalea sp.]|nr:GNAT family N-acetyltransferase [Mobilitalea sp.]
ETYKKLGIGAVILKDGILVSGASSYSRYQDGIEIEIDTKEEFRRKGLAYVCAAKLILECLDKKLYPSWDAQNKWSVALAEKLGYHFDHEYLAYEICGY